MLGPDDLALNHTVVSREMYVRDRKWHQCCSYLCC